MHNRLGDRRDPRPGPAAAVRGPKHVVKTGKTPVLEAAEWRKLLAAIPTDSLLGLRDRALIATLTYAFARTGAALAMRVEDVRAQGAGWEVRLHEKGGKQHAMPCHHTLAEALHAYIEAAGLRAERKAVLFRTSRSRRGDALTERPMRQADAWRMIPPCVREVASRIGSQPLGRRKMEMA
jgi:integrase